MRPEEIFDLALSLRQRAEKAEAEVDRLRAELEAIRAAFPLSSADPAP
jgi:hypothetical protein